MHGPIPRIATTGVMIVHQGPSQTHAGAWRGPLAIFAIVAVVLLPAICTVLNEDFLPLRDGDETWVQTIAMKRVDEWGLLSMVANGLELGYGAPFWLSAGIPTVLFRSLEWDAAAILLSRLVSLVSFAAALSMVWWGSRRAGMPRLPRVCLTGILLLMPSLVANATRMHPEMLLFLSLTVSLAMLIPDEGRLGGWWYAAAAAYGFAVAVKVSAYPAGAGLFAYWLLQTLRTSKIRHGLMAAVAAVLLAPAVFLLANFPLFVGHNLAEFDAALRTALLSNATNHGSSIAGLGWWTWVETSSDYFLWKGWLAAVLIGAAIAAWRECGYRSERPFALVGLVAWSATFFSTALFIKKGSWWHHYLIPAYAAFPWMIVGIYVSGKRWLRIAAWPQLTAACLLVFTTTQVWRATDIWFRHVTIEHSPRFGEAKHEYDVLNEYFAQLPTDRTIRVLRGYEEIVPSRAGKRIETLTVCNRDFTLEMQTKPDYLLVKKDPRWNVWQTPTGNIDDEQGYSSLPDYPAIARSRTLFANARVRLQPMGDFRARLELIRLPLSYTELYRVHYD